MIIITLSAGAGIYASTMQTMHENENYNRDHKVTTGNLHDC